MKKLCYSIGLSVLIVFVLFACDKPKVDSIPILCIGIEIVDSNGNNLIRTKYTRGVFIAKFIIYT